VDYTESEAAVLALLRRRATSPDRSAYSGGQATEIHHLRESGMTEDYTSFPLRKDFYLADDAARSPGAGVRHMEQTHMPRNAAPATAIRVAKEA